MSHDYEQITLTPGRWTSGLKGQYRDDRPVRFSGRELASHCDGGVDSNRKTTWTVYETEGGRIVVSEHYQTAWDGETSWTEVTTWESLDEVPRTVEDDYDHVAGAIPEAVRVKAEDALGIDPAIYPDATGSKWTLYLHVSHARAGLRERIEAAAEEAGIAASEWVWRACETALNGREAGDDM